MRLEIKDPLHSYMKIYEVLVARFLRNLALFSTWHKNNSNNQHLNQKSNLKYGHRKPLQAFIMVNFHSIRFSFVFYVFASP